MQSQRRDVKIRSTGQARCKSSPWQAVSVYADGCTLLLETQGGNLFCLYESRDSFLPKKIFFLKVGSTIMHHMSEKRASKLLARCGYIHKMSSLAGTHWQGRLEHHRKSRVKWMNEVKRNAVPDKQSAPVPLGKINASLLLTCTDMMFSDTQI